ncbi:MAG: tRNA preQ1(34) S-adenosylmethionine ribosyltransferase-isomerase QueA [Thermodesulfobacteriota bacterium]
METREFDFYLPEGLIAQYPLDERDSSRLMVLSRATGEILHRSFREIGEFLRPGDVLVLNDTRVVPARLLGRKATGGKVELLLTGKVGLAQAGKEAWRCMVKPSKGVGPGTRFFFDHGVEAVVLESGPEGFRVCEFTSPLDLEEMGRIPLPPYIRRDAEEKDRERYQTVFAASDGAVAAPTAGLHFTAPLLDGLRASGVEVHRITLHTGPGTFMPVRVKDLKNHRMLPEFYTIPPEVFASVVKAREEGRRVIAVGTTSTRALEAAARDGIDRPVLKGPTGLFIYPGYEFKVVDALLTNFHLPGSTLIMLVSAFAGTRRVMDSYAEAIKQGYRFFSYGDAMLIV